MAIIDRKKLLIVCGNKAMTRSAGTAAYLYLLSVVAKEFGLLALEEYIPETKDLFLKEGLIRITGAVAPDELRNYFVSEIGKEEQQSRRLEMFIIANCIDIMQRGAPSKYYPWYMLKWFPESFSRLYWREFANVTDGTVTDAALVNIIDDNIDELEDFGDVGWLTQNV